MTNIKIQPGHIARHTPQGAGSQGHEWYPFDPEKWLRKRNIAEFDTTDIGALAVPAPSFDVLSKTISKSFSFLLDLSEEELIIASARGKDRPLVLQMLRDLPGGRLKDVSLY